MAGEILIGAVVSAVEDMGCDVRLTDAVVLLQAAKDAIGDFVDGIEKRRMCRELPWTKDGLQWESAPELSFVCECGASWSGPVNIPRYCPECGKTPATQKPQAMDAVDPHAADTGNTSTRDSK